MFKKAFLVVALLLTAGLITVAQQAPAQSPKPSTPPAVTPVTQPAPAVPQTQTAPTASQPQTAAPTSNTPGAQPQGTPAPAPPAVTPQNGAPAPANPTNAAPTAGPSAPSTPQTTGPPPAATPPSVTDPDADPGDPTATQPDPTQSPVQDPFGNPGGNGAPGAGSGYPGDDDGTPPPPPADPTPQNPVEKSYENGKIQIQVGNEREFGNRIGDEVVIDILVLADNKVSLDFRSIAQSFAPGLSDFELVSPPVVRPLKQDQSKTLYLVEVHVQSFVPKKAIVFNADVLYALGPGPDGKAPDWKRLTTPDFVVTTSNTADNGTDLLEGDVDATANRLSWFTYPLLLLGLIGTLLWPSLLFWAWYHRVHPPRVVPPNEQAWRVFNRAFAEGKASGFKVRQYKAIASALRIFLGVEPDTLSEVVFERLKDHPDIATIKSALGKCEQVLYGRKTLTEAQNAELLDELKKLVAKP